MRAGVCGDRVDDRREGRARHLEQQGWCVEIADAQKVKGLAPLACKTDKIDSMVLAVLSHRDLVPAIWLPDPSVREERELARFRLHLVKHKSALKNRIHSTLINFGKPCPVSDLFGAEGRQLLARLHVPEPWRGNINASIELIDDLEEQIAEINRRLKDGHAEHPYIPLLLTVPGIGWVLAFAIAAEIGEIERFDITGEAHRLHRSLSAREPVRGKGSPRPIDQARADLPALGAPRGHNARPQAPRLRRALRANQAPARQAARRESRPGRHRTQTVPRNLAHAFPQGKVRSTRRRFSSGGLTALFGLAPERTSNFA